jgi:nucleotide-binding universal stress UspA family protein
MKPVEKILVPLDFSQCSARALEFALDLARRYEASVDLLYVYHPIVDTLPEAYGVVTAAHASEIVSKLEQQLASAKQDALAAGAQRVGTQFAHGAPVAEILRVAEERGSDLIVMGTHGRSGAKRLFLGSVAENVVRGAKSAVLVVHASGSSD